MKDNAHPLENDTDHDVEDDFMRYSRSKDQVGARKNRCWTWRNCCISTTVVSILFQIAVWSTFGALIGLDYMDVSFHKPGQGVGTITTTITDVVTATATARETSTDTPLFT